MKYGPYSPSRIKCFQACPKQFYFKHIQKLEEEQGDAARKGSEIHDKIKSGVIDKDTQMAQDIKIRHIKYKRVRISSVTQTIRKIDSAGRLVMEEERIGLDENWAEVGYDSPKCYVRGIIDYIVIYYNPATIFDGTPHTPEKIDKVAILDWKTGQNKVSNFQIEFYVVLMCGLLKINTDKIKAEYVYTAKGIPTFIDMQKGEFEGRKIRSLDKIKAGISKNIEKIESCEEFKECRQLCQWCAFKSKCGCKDQEEINKINERLGLCHQQE